MTATAPRFSYRICSYVILPSLDGLRRRRAPRRERESLLQPLDFMGIHLVDILLRRFRQLDRLIAGREEDDCVAARHTRAVMVLDPDIQMQLVPSIYLHLPSAIAFDPTV